MNKKYKYSYILEDINFGDVLLINPFNDNANLIDEKFDTLWGYDFDSNIRNIMWYSNFIIKKLPHLIKTDYYLIVQWDGFPLFFNDLENNWKSDFLNFEFLGGGHSVYNGGFSLRTKKCMKEVINKKPIGKIKLNTSTINYMKNTTKRKKR